MSNDCIGRDYYRHLCGGAADHCMCMTNMTATNTCVMEIAAHWFTVMSCGFGNKTFYKHIWGCGGELLLFCRHLSRFHNSGYLEQHSLSPTSTGLDLSFVC